MAIGYTVTVGSINSQAGTLAIRWQQMAADMLAFNAIAGGLSVANLQALGFTLTDATNMAAIIADMGNFANVYYGNQAQAPGFNYYGVFRAVRGLSV